MFFYIFLCSSVCSCESGCGGDVCKQIFVDMCVEASGRAQVSFSGTPSTVLGFLWWFIDFGGGGLSLRKGLSLVYNLPIRLYWLASKHQ